MLTLEELMSNTPNDVAKRSQETLASVSSVKVVQRRGEDGISFETKSRSITDKNYWNQIIEFYPEEIDEGVFLKLSMDTPVWLTCNCPFFMFNCEYAVYKKGSTDLININKNKKGSLKSVKPLVTNPREIPFLCKHLYKVSPALLKQALKVSKQQKRVEFV